VVLLLTAPVNVGGCEWWRDLDMNRLADNAHLSLLHRFLLVALFILGKTLRLRTLPHYLLAVTLTERTPWRVLPCYGRTGHVLVCCTVGLLLGAQNHSA